MVRRIGIVIFLILSTLAGFCMGTWGDTGDYGITDGDLLLSGDERAVVWYNGSNYWSMRSSSSMVSDANYIWPATVGDVNTALAIDANSSGEITLKWGTFGDANGLLPDKTPGSIMFADSTGYPLGEDNANLFFDDTNDYVGIGLNNPRDGIEVANLVIFDPTLFNTLLGTTAGSEISAGTNNTHVGYNAGLYGDGSDNVTLGYLAGEGTTGNGYSNSVILGSQAAIDLTTGSNNFIAGYQAGYNLITGTDNVIIGYQAGLGIGAGVTDRTSSNTVIIGSQAGYAIDDSSVASASGSVFIGYQTGYYNRPGGSTASDIFIGYQCGRGSSGGTGYNNVGIGHQALLVINNGFYNIAMGYEALNDLTNGDWNTALGHGSLGKLTTGNYNTGVSDTLAALATGSNNTAVGYESANFIAAGADNTTFGYGAGRGASGNDYSYNSIFGSQAGYNVSTSSNNLLAGFKAGNALTTGGSHVFLGYYAGAYDTTDTNLFYLNNQDRVTTNREQYEDLFYGVMAATPGAQDLDINADVIIRNDSSLGSESLDEVNFATHAKWDVTGDFDDTGGNATYIHSTGSGTLTQTSGNMATAGVANRWYRFTYSCTNAAAANTTPTITTSFASAAVSLPKGTGSHTVYFLSAASPGDFVISVTSSSGDTWRIDDFSLKRLAGGDLIVNGDLDVYGNITGTGGSFTTGITDTQVVYSNAGVLAGHADFTWDDTNRILDVNAIDVNDVATLKPNSAVFQPATNSTTFLQFKDQAGNVDFNYDSTNGWIGIGTTPLAALDVAGMMILSPNRTNGTLKLARWFTLHYNSDTEEKVLGLDVRSDATNTRVILGGGDATANAATDILFYTAANTTTTTGTLRAMIDSSGRFGLGDGITGFPTFNALLDIRSTSPEIAIAGAAVNQVESGRIRLKESGSNYQGAYVYYNGSTNIFSIGTHAAADSSSASDIPAIIIPRGGYNIGLGGESAPETLIEMTTAAPIITTHCDTHSNAAGSGASRWIGKREDGAGTETAAGQIEIAHDGAGVNDQLGYIKASVNTGAGLVDVLKIDSAGNLLVPYRIGIGSGSTAPASNLEIIPDSNIRGLDIDGTTNLTTAQGFRIVMNPPTSSADGRAFTIDDGSVFSRSVFYSNTFYGMGSGAATRDTFIGRSAANTVRIGNAYDGSGEGHLIVGGNLTVGSGTAATDYTITFNGETADGILTWMEDEDYIKFSDDTLHDTSENAYFRDTAIHINSSSDGQMDIDADGVVEVTAPQIQLNGFEEWSTTSGITATNPGVQGDSALTTTLNEVFTVANANDAVTLPAAAVGRHVIIINNGANTLEIWPASGDNAGAGVDTAVTLASGSNVHYASYDSTNWESI